MWVDLLTFPLHGLCHLVEIAHLVIEVILLGSTTGLSIKKKATKQKRLQLLYMIYTDIHQKKKKEENKTQKKKKTGGQKEWGGRSVIR